MKDGKKSDQNCDNTQDLQNGLKLQSNYSKYAIVMTLPVDWALEWLAAVGYSCSRHVAEACGMPDASPGGVDKPDNGQTQTEGMQGARRLRRDKRGIPRLARELRVGSRGMPCRPNLYCN